MGEYSGSCLIYQCKIKSDNVSHDGFFDIINLTSLRIFFKSKKALENIMRLFKSVFRKKENWTRKKIYFGLLILPCFSFNFIMSIPIQKRLVKYKNPFIRKMN